MKNPKDALAQIAGLLAVLLIISLLVWGIVAVWQAILS